MNELINLLFFHFQQISYLHLLFKYKNIIFTNIIYLLFTYPSISHLINLTSGSIINTSVNSRIFS